MIVTQTFNGMLRGARPCSNRTSICCVFLLALCSATEAQTPADAPATTEAQAPEIVEPARLIDVEPFDRLTLDEINESTNEPEVLQIVPVEFPGRRLPKIRRPGDEISIRLFSKPGEEFKVQWRNIESLEFYEDMVLAEGLKLTAENRFDEAFEYFQFLTAGYPHTLDLQKGLQTFLIRHAGKSFQAHKHVEAISLLADAHQINPARAGLARALANVTGKLLESHQRAGNHEAVRQLLKQAIARYPNNPEARLTEWRDRLVAAADAELKRANSQLAAGNLRAAQLASRQMMRIWPELPGAAALQTRIANQYPMLFVGVSQSVPFRPDRTVDRPSSWRIARLIEKPLVRIDGYDPNGAIYVSPWGTMTTGDSGRSITFDLVDDLPAGSSDTRTTGYELARRLVQPGPTDEPSADVWWSRLIRGVDVQAVYRVHINLNASYVRPEALFRHIGLDGDAGSQRGSLFSIGSQTDEEVSYVLKPNGRPVANGQIREVLEQSIASPQHGIVALRQGKIDILARLFPGDVAALAGDEEIVVGRYRLPTIHCLVPNYDRKRMKSRVLRRGLLQGFNRNEILQRVLLRGNKLPGCQVLSGPLPVGFSREDPLGYGYDHGIVPRDYEKNLALTLFRVAGAAANRTPGGLLPDQPLVLAHPAAYLPRLACEEIAHQLSMNGIACDTRQLPPGAVVVPDSEYDLLYVEVSMAEPIVDVIGLLGRGGLGDAGNPYIRLAINRLIRATNWRDARTRLATLHQLCHHHLPVLPLWQLSDHYAYHRRITGIEAEPISLYQNITKWRVGPK